MVVLKLDMNSITSVNQELIEERENSDDGIVHSRFSNVGVLVQELRLNKHISEKTLNNGISAFNFTNALFASPKFFLYALVKARMFICTSFVLFCLRRNFKLKMLPKIINVFEAVRKLT